MQQSSREAVAHPHEFFLRKNLFQRNILKSSLLKFSTTIFANEVNWYFEMKVGEKEVLK